MSKSPYDELAKLQQNYVFNTYAVVEQTKNGKQHVIESFLSSKEASAAKHYLTGRRAGRNDISYTVVKTEHCMVDNEKPVVIWDDEALKNSGSMIFYKVSLPASDVVSTWGDKTAAEDFAKAAADVFKKPSYNVEMQGLHFSGLERFIKVYSSINLDKIFNGNEGDESEQ